MALFDGPVTVDGAIGSKTVADAQRVQAKVGRFFGDAYAIALRDYYLALADRCPASRKFARTRAGRTGAGTTFASTGNAAVDDWKRSGK